MTDALKTARDRFRRCQEAMEDNRLRAEEADKFSAGLEQWPEAIRMEREQDKRPCLTMDETNQYINQIKNDQRQNKAAVKVRPVDDKADKKVAEMLQGVIRHIEDGSSAEIAYDTAFEHALRGGYGYWRIYTDYCDENSFDQEIKIGRIRNRFSVYLDPDHQEPDGSDARYGFITEWMKKDDFKKAYPDADLKSWETDKDCKDWINEDDILVADYYFIREEDKTLVQLPDGSSVLDEEIPEEVSREGTKSRTTTVKNVIWQKISGGEVLEETEWMGKYIPIVEVIGNESEIDGKRILTGIVHAAMDAQRMHNYAISAMVEDVALAPRAPYTAAAGQIEGFEKQWEDANRRNIPVLPYHPISVDGVAVPPPIRQPRAGLSQGWAEIMGASRMWIQASMGQYNASIGAEGQEKSGKAIIARQREGDVGSFHYHDNLARSIRHTGRILIDLIPKIYDTKRVVRILGEDGEPDAVLFDPEMVQAHMEAPQQDGSVLMLYNPTIGKYDVTVSVGPSYSTKRQEAAETQMQMVQAAPDLMPVIGDILVRNMDWPGADQIADRLKAMLPPQIKELENKPNEQGLEAKAAQLQQTEEVLMDKAQKLFQKEQELQQAEQQIQEAGQATEKEMQALKDLRAEIENESITLDAERKVLAAEKSRIAAEFKLAQANMEGTQKATNERAEEASETETRTADLTTQVTSMLANQAQSNQAATLALIQAIERLSAATTAPKRYIYNDQGDIVGSEPVVMN